MPKVKNPSGAVEQEFRVAEHQFHQGNAARALPHFRRALLIDPASLKMKLRVGQCLDRLGKIEEAYRTFREILEQDLNPCEKNVRVEILIAFTNACLRSGKEREVVEAVAEQTQLVEETPALFYNLGLAHYKNGQFDDALQTFDRLKAIHPKNSAGFVGLAILHCHFNRLENAMHVLQEARKAAPDDMQIVENLAVVQMKIANPLGAISTLRSAAHRLSKNARLLHLLGMAYLRLGDLSRAEKYLFQSLDVERLPDALREIGWIRIARGDYEIAINILKEALEINPNDTWAKVDLAVAYFKKGGIAEAQILFNEARAAAPKSGLNKVLDDLAKLLAAGQKT